VDKGISRRSFIRSGAAVSGGLVAAGVLTACGSSSSSSTGAATTSSTAPITNGDQALQSLLAGNQRFVNGTLSHPRRETSTQAAQAESQSPHSIIVSCSDSRVLPEIIFDDGIGDLFVVRVAGNTGADPILQGSIEYGAAVLGSVLLMVLGHENCGAVKAALDNVTAGKTVPGQIGAVVQPILPAAQAVTSQPKDAQLNAAIQQNVRNQVALLKASTPILAPLVSAGKLKVVGGEYNFQTGAVQLVA
jgi:carbonic anhydrase